ncbi:MAG TPA: histidine kinase [Chitinophagales bacterium]|nr:histidine kinase [Chitinophagales bacterium]
MLHAQNRVYKNYGVKNGLAGAVVYYAYQDREGFLWFGTDLGLSRFDGTDFKNYTTTDGLPDNDVFRIEEDTIGRLWLICYNSKPCYIYHNKVYTSDNDSTLNSIDSENQLFRNITADRQGRAWIIGQKVYMVDGNKVTKYETPGGEPATSMGYLGNRLSLVTSTGVYTMDITNGKAVYHLVKSIDNTPNNSSVFYRNHCYIVEQFNNGETGTILSVGFDTVLRAEIKKLGLRELITNHSVYNPADSAVYISAGLQGVQALSKKMKLLPEPFPFLPHDVSYSYTLFDRSGNTWVCSLGKGVFFIPSVRTVRYRFESRVHSSNASSLFKTADGRLFVGFDYSHFGVLKGEEMEPYMVQNQMATHNKLVRQCSIDGKHILIATDMGLFEVNTQNPLQSVPVSGLCVKNITFEGPDSALMGTIGYAVRVRETKSGFAFDTLWNNRTTAIVKGRQGKIWLGSLNGLYVREPDGEVHLFKTTGIISKSRINDLFCDVYGNIWVATNQHGIFVITGDSIINITMAGGLPGNLCSRLYSNTPGVVWVCTNLNISQITYSTAPSFSYNVRTPGGLSDGVEMSVNDILVDSADIWVATTDGLMKMENQTREKAPAPPVYITGFKTPDSVYTDFNHLKLPYSENNVQIDYIGIWYSMAGETVYKYLLNTDNPDTVFTDNNTLNLSSLQPGVYTLQVWAKNIAGMWSTSPAVLTFEVVPPVWETGWFITLVGLTGVILIWFLVTRQLRAIQRKAYEKTRHDKKMAEMELQAVRAQMNEHFIFNSLNSIQNFINRHDTEAANYYLGNFGKLIRRTMDISSRPDISLSDEIDYLNTYLTLEKMRFGDKMDYRITNNIHDIPAYKITFPSLMLQPYVENAIKHGLRYKQDGNGLVEITFSLNDGFVVCSIDDNGVGRAKAGEMKSMATSVYQSKGMGLSQDKIYLYNQIHNNKIRVEVIDKTDDEGNPTGTLVKVLVPLNAEE